MLIIIFLFFIISIYNISSNKGTGPAHELIDKGYPKSDDKINILVDRIEWSNHYIGRIRYVYRYFIYSVILSFIINIIIHNKIIISNLIKLILPILCCLLILNLYFIETCDKFHNFCIDKNLNILRKKLNIKRGIFNKLNKIKINNNKPFAFYYKYI